MSKYFDADDVREKFGIKGFKPTCAGCGGCMFTVFTKNDICLAIDDMPTADVVSREQYNECYDQCLRLRSENEQLMDSLRAYEDDRK